MRYEVEQSIYKVSQDHDTDEVTFYVHGREEKTIEADKLLTHDELYELLLRCVHEYQIKKRGEI